MWIVHLRALDGLLLGGFLETTSSTFDTRTEAEDWMRAALDTNAGKCTLKGWIYGPHVRVELSPATDHWMRGDRYGVIVEVFNTGRICVRLDKSGRSVHLRANYLQGYAR